MKLVKHLHVCNEEVNDIRRVFKNLCCFALCCMLEWFLFIYCQYNIVRCSNVSVSAVFLDDCQPTQPLAVYPVFLFYFIIGWIVLSLKHNWSYVLFEELSTFKNIVISNMILYFSIGQNCF